MTDRPSASEERLRALFAEHADQVLRYAMRHTDSSSAHEIVSDVFLVAWRRIDDVPDEPLPWLLVVARNAVRNRTRALTRRRRVAAELQALADTTRASADRSTEDTVVERAAVLAALQTLTTDQREALLLVAWDGLTAAQAAGVAGCSRGAFEVRLHRARARLREALGDSSPGPPSAAVPATTTATATKEAVR